MTETNQTMGKRIMALRKQAGMTQEQLAERLGVSPQAVSKWENDVSCPDIGTLPKLAEVFGVSTDVLLGVVSGNAEAEPKPNFSCEKENSAPKVETAFGTEESSHKKAHKLEGVGFALVLIAVGAAYLISNTAHVYIPFDLWSVVWPAALLGLGIAGGIKHRAPFLFGAAFIGLYYLLAALGSPLPFPLTWSVVWPLALVLLGINILVDKLFPKKHGKTVMQGGRHSYSEENGYVTCDLSFSSDNIIVTAPTVHGCNIDISFGECTIDFTRCGGFDDNAKIDIDVSFGSCKILLPSTVRAVSNASSSFGSLDIKGEPQPSSKPVYIDGDVSFGSTEIQYR